MNSLRFFALLILAIIFTNCSQHKTDEPVKTVKHFLIWLQKSGDQAYDSKCWSDTPGEDGGYSTSGADEKCLQNYIKRLQQTDLFTATYTDSLNAVFQRRLKDIRATGSAETDDVIRFFENQDPPAIPDLLKAIDEKTIVITYLANEQEALVRVYPGPPYNSDPHDPSAYSMDFKLKVENDRWKIACFECYE